MKLIAGPRKILSQMSVLLTDPRRFVENADFSLHPDKLLQKLLTLEPLPPLHLSVGASRPHLNVLLPSLSPAQLTGGPNTALNIACRLALLGVPVRILAVDERLPADMDSLWAHVLSVAGVAERPATLRFASSWSAGDPAAIGVNDAFLTTSWTTAHRLKPVLPRMAIRKFFYLIQDFEAGFYPWSSSYAQALSTYGMDFIPLINETLLADYLFRSATGRFGDPAFAKRCIVFEPAVDRSLFYPRRSNSGRRRLLFYARPNQPRNMFGIGFEALRIAAASRSFRHEDWEFIAIGNGGGFATMHLGADRNLVAAPWRDYASYAQLLREADILLSLMLSPHTGYPVLEMAACRGLAVTNSFSNKTEDALAQISPRIITAEPEIGSVADALRSAADHTRAEELADAAPNLPLDWTMALGSALPRVRDAFHALVAGGCSGDQEGTSGPSHPPTDLGSGVSVLLNACLEQSPHYRR